MRVDDTKIGELITESQDLQVDAMRTAKAVLPAMVDAGHDPDSPTKDPEVIQAFHQERRRVLAERPRARGRRRSRVDICLQNHQVVIGPKEQ